MAAARIVILTGAGISAESGLGTFRDVGGLWSQYDLEDVATPAGFAKDPDLVLRFYEARRTNALGATPNAAHSALARLERAHPGVTIVTQNIDALHEEAGCTRVLHMHGRLDTAQCAICGHRWPAERYATDVPCPACGARAMRPDVVWFGEMPRHMDQIGELLAGADLFVAIGTSGSVYPAAGFVMDAAASGARTLELNLDRSDLADVFDAGLYGRASEVVPAWVDEVLGAQR